MSQSKPEAKAPQAAQAAKTAEAAKAAQTAQATQAAQTAQTAQAAQTTQAAQAAQAGQTAQTAVSAQQVKAEKPVLVPQHLRSTASMNTAALIAGPKPWSKDWVFADGVPQAPQAEKTAEQSQILAGGEARSSEVSPLQTGDVSEEAVQSWMAAISGSIESTGTSTAPLPKGMPDQTPRAATPFAALSGAEFLGALKAVGRDGEAGSNESDLGGNPQSRGRDLKPVPGEMGKTGSIASAKPFAMNELTQQAGGPSRLKSLKGNPLDSAEAATAWNAQATGQAVAKNGMSEPASGTPVVTGHVVPGAASRERLSSESLAGIGTQIRGLGAQGGEMRIRMKPENLGELHMKITTQGNTVGIQIQASDERAKRILEDSLSHLKESLASQSLTLGQVDVNVSQSSASSGGGAFGESQQNAWNQQSQWDSSSSFNRNFQQGSDGGTNEGWQSEGRDGNVRSIAGRGASTAAMASQRSRSADSSGRLNVMA